MTDIENSSTSTNEEGWDSQDTNQNSTEQVDLTKYVPIADYENIQAFATKARQNEIARTTRLVEKDSSELHNLDDAKLKDSVTKSLLNMTYAEATAVYGSNFDLSNKDKSDEDKGNDSKLTNVEKELRLMKFKESIREVDYELSKFESANPNMFWANAEVMREKIKEELANVSTTLPIDERVRRAATISLWNPMDLKSLAYSFLNWAQAGSAAWISSVEEAQKTKTQKLTQELREFWKLDKKKK